MRNGSLGVTLFSVCMSARPYVRKFLEIQFGMPGMAGDGPDHPQSSGPEVGWKWVGSGPVCPSVWPSVCTSLASLTNLMRGIYKCRALAPCDYMLLNEMLLNKIQP